MRWHPLLLIGNYAQGGSGDEMVAIVNVPNLLLKAVAMIIRTTLKECQNSSKAPDINMIDVALIGGRVKNSTNESRKWKLNFGRSAKLPLQNQY
jgi:hypothetical protein